MTFFQFISYEPTHENPKQMGVATVKLYGKIKLRYKIVTTKDGQGWFPIPASYQLGKTDDGKDKYVSAFMLNDRDEEETLIAAIRANVALAMKGQEMPSNPSMQDVPTQYTSNGIPNMTQMPDPNLPF
jgi:hypothetical protein